MCEQRIITRFPDGAYRSADGFVVALEVSRPEGGRQVKEWVMRDPDGARLAGAGRLADLVRAQNLRFGKLSAASTADAEGPDARSGGV